MKFDYSSLLEKNSTYIVAEAGSNWKVGSYEEDVSEAKKMIKTAANAGADAIKFQIFKVSTLYAHNAGHSDYLKKSGIDDDINTMFDKLSMPSQMIPELVEECKKNGINFMSSAFSVEDAKLIDPFVDVHKIASYEINHVRLLEYVAKTEKPVIISTGASTYEEIDFALKIIGEYSKKVAILQCTACYPSPLESLNLQVIKKFIEKYNIPIGFSDHSIEPFIAPIIAVGLGAKIIEKHFTLDKNKIGPDHKFAINPDELKTMVNMIRNAEKALGTEDKKIENVEKELRIFAKRSLQATKDIKKGEVLLEGENFDVLRPGKQIRGLDARFFNSVKGKKAIKDIRKGEGITGYE